jgi:peptide subunit release factor RF-3
MAARRQSSCGRPAALHTTVTALGFELESVMSAAHGDAIVGMKVAATSYDRGSQMTAARSWAVEVLAHIPIRARIPVLC